MKSDLGQMYKTHTLYYAFTYKKLERLLLSFFAQTYIYKYSYGTYRVGAMTLSIMTLSITTFSITTLNISIK
jgi:hypothetical protein